MFQIISLEVIVAPPTSASRLLTRLYKIQVNLFNLGLDFVEGHSTLPLKTVHSGLFWLWFLQGLYCAYFLAENVFGTRHWKHHTHILFLLTIVTVLILRLGLWNGLLIWHCLLSPLSMLSVRLDNTLCRVNLTPSSLFDKMDHWLNTTIGYFFTNDKTDFLL